MALPVQQIDGPTAYGTIYRRQTVRPHPPAWAGTSHSHQSEINADTCEWSTAGVILAATCDPPLRCAPPPPAAWFALRSIRLAAAAARFHRDHTPNTHNESRAVRPWPFRWPIEQQVVESSYSVAAPPTVTASLLDLIA